MATLKPVTLARFALLRPLAGERIAQLTLLSDLVDGAGSALAAREMGVEVEKIRTANDAALKARDSEHAAALAAAQNEIEGLKSQLAAVSELEKANRDEELRVQAERVTRLEAQVSALEKEKTELAARLGDPTLAEKAQTILASMFRKEAWDNATWVQHIDKTLELLAEVEGVRNEEMLDVLQGMGLSDDGMLHMLRLADLDTPAGKRLRDDRSLMMEQAKSLVDQILARIENLREGNSSPAIAEQVMIKLPAFGPAKHPSTTEAAATKSAPAATKAGARTTKRTTGAKATPRSRKTHK